MPNVIEDEGEVQVTQQQGYWKTFMTNRAIKKLTDSYNEVVTSVFRRNRIANINMRDAILTNFESAASMFKGFFGEPSHYDDDLMMYQKVVGKSASMKRKFFIAQSMVAKLGFHLSCVDLEDDGNMKVMLTPGADISSYQSHRALDEKFKNVDHLYQKVRL
jgi:hypothetical protein